jgi:hypothetical protein
MFAVDFSLLVHSHSGLRLRLHFESLGSQGHISDWPDFPTLKCSSHLSLESYPASVELSLRYTPKGGARVLHRPASGRGQSCLVLVRSHLLTALLLSLRYTPKGGTRVTTLDQIEDGGTYVAASTEPFRKLDYESIQSLRVREKTMAARRGTVSANERHTPQPYLADTAMRLIHPSNHPLTRASIHPSIHPPDHVHPSTHTRILRQKSLLVHTCSCITAGMCRRTHQRVHPHANITGSRLVLALQLTLHLRNAAHTTLRTPPSHLSHTHMRTFSSSIMCNFSHAQHQ